MIRPPALYAIADGDVLGGAAFGGAASGGAASGGAASGGDDPVTAAVGAMAEAGIRWIQVRLKSVDDRRFFEIVERCVRRIEGSDSRLWINDRPDVAALFPVFGVHVGQDDLPPAAARRALSPGQAIGLSCHDEAQIRRANADPEVDVLACGPVFPTRSKKHPDPTIGLEGVAAARRASEKPLVAIGGIDSIDRARQVLDAGADTVVVLGALCRGGDISANCRRWMKGMSR